MESELNIPTVSWTKLQGNKYSKSLTPHMLLKGGYPVTMQSRVVGETKSGSKIVTVIFDRNYIVNWLIVKVIKALENEGLDAILELVKEAWRKSHPVYICPELKQGSKEFSKEEMN